jgi:hypothetical protein
MPNIIDSIQLSGVTYGIKGSGGTQTIELTQAQYDALAVKDPNTFYIITDATAGDLTNYYTKTETDDLLDTKLDASAYTPTDLSNYYTKSETSGATQIQTALASKADTATTYTKTEVDNAITAATSTKQDTLVSGTNIKTINNESILGSGNIDIQGGGGGMTEDDELLLATALTDLNDRKIGASEVKSQLGNYQKKGDYVTTSALNTRLAEYETALDEQNVEEVTAYALNDLNNKFGGLKLVKITESEYAALTTKDENTLYIVVADPS